MASQVFDGEAVRASMRAFLSAYDALEAASGDTAVLELSDVKVLAALTLRKALVEAGWTAPVGQRSTR